MKVISGQQKMSPSDSKKLMSSYVIFRHRISRLTVQLVNNEVFPSSLNIELTYMFLDMKDGAKIVSLKPFEPEVVRMNESNVSSQRV